MAIVKQIPNIVNDAVKDALGKSATITQLKSTDLVSMGRAIEQADAYESFYKSLTNRLVKTIYFVRSYETKTRSVLRDEHEFGAFVQKVYYKLPEAVDNPTWAIPHTEASTDVYSQVSPFDVQGTVGVKATMYSTQGTWSIEIIRPIEQIRTAFLSLAQMMAFIDGIYVTVDNAFKLEEERLTALAVNTAMASAINGGNSRNLLSEYNTIHSTSLTPTQALETADFLKYASMEINRTIDNMGRMSTLFNKNGWETFTSKENMVVEMLAQFASATDMYLQADTFHNELTKLPNFEKIPFWQYSGKKFDFADTSSIKIEHSELSEVVNKSGIICFIHDIENVACYFGKRRTWEVVNPRSEVVIHGEKAEKGYAVDNNANAVVFYIA